MRFFRVTDDIKAAAHAVLDARLKELAYESGSSVTVQVPSTDFPVKKAEVTFTECAWKKIQKLVSEFDTEIGWHATAEREADGKYRVLDVFVYPQIISGASVRVDVEAKQKWYDDFDDTTFNKIRLQGHSHVNFSVSPSSGGPTSDTYTYAEFARQVKGENFYIFMIINKSGDMWMKICDAKLNMIFEDKDIEYSIEGQTDDLKEFLEEAKKQATEPKQTWTKKTSVSGLVRKPYCTKDTDYGYDEYEDFGYYGRYLK